MLCSKFHDISEIQMPSMQTIGPFCFKHKELLAQALPTQPLGSRNSEVFRDRENKGFHLERFRPILWVVPVHM